MAPASEWGKHHEQISDAVSLILVIAALRLSRLHSDRGLGVPEQLLGSLDGSHVLHCGYERAVRPLRDHPLRAAGSARHAAQPKGAQENESINRTPTAAARSAHRRCPPAAISLLRTAPPPGKVGTQCEFRAKRLCGVHAFILGYAQPGLQAFF